MMKVDLKLPVMLCGNQELIREYWWKTTSLSFLVSLPSLGCLKVASGPAERLKMGAEGNLKLPCNTCLRLSASLPHLGAENVHSC